MTDVLIDRELLERLLYSNSPARFDATEYNAARAELFAILANPTKQGEAVCDWPTCECALDLDKCKVQSVEPAPAQDEREAFERETRYIVIKRSDLAKLDQAGLLRPESLDGLVDICGRLPPREYVVVESDWPEFQPTWAAIEARVSGLATPVPAGSKVVPVELLERLEHVTRALVPHLQCHVDLRALLASVEGGE